MINYQLIYCADSESEAFLDFKPVTSNQTTTNQQQSTFETTSLPTAAVSSKKENKFVFKENNYNVYTRPFTSGFTKYQSNFTEVPFLNTNNSSRKCYRSLKEWKIDQNMRFSKILYSQKMNSNSFFNDWRLQKPYNSFYTSIWSFLPDGMQIYLLRQKESSTLSIFTNVKKEPCCYANAYYRLCLSTWFTKFHLLF